MAVKEMKSGRAPRLDVFPVEYLKKGSISVLEWQGKLLNINFYMGVLLMDRRGACIVPMYKGKGDKCDIM